MPDRFTGKTAIITGGADGIGKAVAERLGREGAKIVLFDVNAALLEAAKHTFSTEGIHVLIYPVDISKEDEVKDAMQSVETLLGKIDILINAAGIVGPTSTKITEYSAADFDRVYAVNLRGSFLVAKYALQSMKKSGKGRVLLIASIAGKEGNPGMTGYSTSKAGVIGLVKGIAKEFADTEITINSLAPAVIKTNLNANTTQEQMNYMTSKIPMGRMGTVEEVAAMCCFIVSDENSFSTGFTYDISGGRATY